MNLKKQVQASASVTIMHMRCTGFSFCNYNAHEMLNTIRYAERIYYDKKRDWNKIVERAMSQDFSWKNSARQYEDLYRSLIGE